MRFIPNNLQPSWGTADPEGCRAVFAQAPHPVSPNQQRTLLDAETPVQLREAGPGAHPRPGAGHAAREGLWAWECPAGTSCPPCVLPVCGDSGPMVEGEQCQEAGGPGSSPNPAPSRAPPASQFSSRSASPKRSTENNLPPTLAAPRAGTPLPGCGQGLTLPLVCLDGSRR